MQTLDTLESFPSSPLGKGRGNVSMFPMQQSLFLFHGIDYAISKPGTLSQVEQGRESSIGDQQDLEEREIITDPSAGE